MVFDLEFALESSLLVLMILGIRKIFIGKIRYAGIYALWFLVLLRFMIPVNIISTPFSVGGIIPETLLVQPEEELAGKNPGQTVEAAGGLEGHFSDGTSGEGNQVEWKGNQGDTALSLRNIDDGQKSDSWSLFNMLSANGRVVLKNGRLIVSGILLLWFVLSNVVLMRKLKRSRISFGKRDTVRVYVTPDIANPCLYGFFRPAIYLPESLVSGDGGGSAAEEEIKQMITHEYVHYRHGDHIWAMFRVFLVSVYWFNPFLWLAVSCSKKDAELFCDETVIRLLGERRRFCYGKMLVRLAGDANWGEFRYPIMSMSRRGKEMEKRIRALSRKRSYSRWVAIPLVLLVLAAAGITCSTKSVPSAGETKNAELTEMGDTATGAAVGSEEKQQKDDKAAQTAGQGNKEQPSFTVSNSGVVYNVDGSEASSVDMQAIEEAFGQYIEIFTEAVNTGNTDRMSQVLYVGSDVYEQQCELVKNYYKRGIREKIKTCSISAAKAITSEQVEIISKEKIKVFYADTDAKIIKQRYQYTCEYIDERWIITGMDEIPQTDEMTQ